MKSSRQRRRRQMAGTAYGPARVMAPGTGGLRLRRLFQRPGPMSIGARLGRLILGLPLVLVGFTGVYLVMVAPGAYGKSVVTDMIFNGLTLLVSAATAVLGGVICLNALRAPWKAPGKRGYGRTE